jgi:hypothetical protein
LTSALDGCELHAPAALPSGKESPVPIGQEAGWAPEPFWTWCLRKNSQLLPGIEPRSSDRPVRSQSLSRLYVINQHYFEVAEKSRIIFSMEVGGGQTQVQSLLCVQDQIGDLLFSDITTRHDDAGDLDLNLQISKLGSSVFSHGFHFSSRLTS